MIFWNNSYCFILLCGYRKREHFCLLSMGTYICSAAAVAQLNIYLIREILGFEPMKQIVAVQHPYTQQQVP